MRRLRMACLGGVDQCRPFLWRCFYDALGISWLLTEIIQRKLKWSHNKWRDDLWFPRICLENWASLMFTLCRWCKYSWLIMTLIQSACRPLLCDWNVKRIRFGILHQTALCIRRSDSHSSVLWMIKLSTLIGLLPFRKRTNNIRPWSSWFGNLTTYRIIGISRNF